MEKHPSMIKAYCNIWSEIFPTPSVWWYSIIIPTSIFNLWFPESITSTLLLPIPQNTAQNLWNGTHATRLMRTPHPRPKKPGQCRQGRSKQGLTRCTHLNRPGLVGGEGGWVVEGVSRKSGAKWNTEIKTGDYWFLEMRHDCNDMWWNDKKQYVFILGINESLRCKWWPDYSLYSSETPTLVWLKESYPTSSVDIRICCCKFFRKSSQRLTRLVKGQ